jgi:hypothetical protein
VPPTRPAATPPAAHALHREPLTDLVSAVGLRWLVLVKPQQILAGSELGPAIEAIIPGPRLAAFSESSGVDLRAVPEALVAGFPYSTLYLAALPNDVAALARARFSERLLSGVVTKRPRPGLVRITGVIGQTPETLLTVEERMLAVAVGDPLPVTIAEAYAEGRLKTSPTALRGAALSALPDDLLSPHSPFVLLAPGPFPDEWQRAAGGLLPSAVALAIAAEPIGHGKLATTLYLAGAWQSSAADATSRLGAAWTALAHSPTGRLFELNEVAEVEAKPELLTLRVELELAALLRGIRASVLGDLSLILRVPGANERAAQAEPAPSAR